jgi:GNAT superfamily N-acetyltransferase
MHAPQLHKPDLDAKMAARNYLKMSDDEIADFTYLIRNELHAGIPANVMHSSLRSGHTIIHRYLHGYCIIRRHQSASVYLWVMYVDPEVRCMGVGTTILQDIIHRYAAIECTINLLCPESLQPFYMKSGFHKVIRADNLVELVREFKGETESRSNSATAMI